MTTEPKVSLRNLYKIFGSDSQEALKHVKNGLSKEELLVQHKHVLGLQDINVDMQEGEITVVMGLSGSGKSTLIRHLNRLIDPTDGEIWVDGQDVMKLNEEEKAMLGGELGEPRRWAIEHMLRVGRFFDAPDLALAAATARVSAI